ncbi:MAG: TlyA family RNA methyltransferase [SAR202 cluster bacterium]|nr:TlyA family RNA methyltransferase [SAR202 cluster bacterium]
MRRHRPPVERVDVLLTERGMAETRAKAQALVRAGRVFSGEQRVDTVARRLPADAPLRVGLGPRFVSRGGEKMAGALDALGLATNGMVALDLGASTGGFTDCLLQRGAARVYAVDVGRGQLDARLRGDPRVVVMERVNAREGFDLPEPMDLLVADVSFISLHLVLRPALRHLRPGAHLLVLVKPQFEAGKKQVGAGGIVADPRIHAQVVGDFCLWAIARGLRVGGVRPSVIEGGSGNQEYFVLLRKAGGAA